MTMQLAGFTVGNALVFVYVELDKPQLLTDIELLLSAHDATLIADDSEARLVADIEQWLADQDLLALEADIAAERDMHERYYRGWMT